MTLSQLKLLCLSTTSCRPTIKIWHTVKLQKQTTCLNCSFKKMCCWQLCQINNFETVNMIRRLPLQILVHSSLVALVPLVCDDPFAYFLISGNREKSPSEKIHSTEMVCFCCSRYRVAQISASVLILIRPALQGYHCTSSQIYYLSVWQHYLPHN